MKVLCAVLLGCLVAVGHAAITSDCIRCIGKVEGGGSGCNMDVGSLSCGRYQIKEPYWIDCGRPNGDWARCAASDSCATQCIKTYMKRYEDGCKRALGKSSLSCEDYGRLHNGGPNGCRTKATDHYVSAMRRKC